MDICPGDIAVQANAVDASVLQAACAESGRVGLGREGGVDAAVEGVGGITQIAPVGVAVGVLVGPEIEVVLAVGGIGLIAQRIPGVLPEAVGALQIQVGKGRGRVRKADVPDEQSFAGQVAVVVGALPAAVFQEEEFPTSQGYMVQGAAAADILQGHGVGGAVGPGDLGPAQLHAAPGRKGGGSIIAVPAQGAPTHQAPVADAGRVVFRSAGIFGPQKLGVE